MRKPGIALFLGGAALALAVPAMPDSRADQVRKLRTKQMLVAMWGWPPADMAKAAKAFGYQVVQVNEPDASAFIAEGLDVIARFPVEIKDPFDEQQVAAGIEKLKSVARRMDNSPGVVALLPHWGLYGEGGFPYDFDFTKGVAAFNAHENTPDAPQPQPPADGLPADLRFIRWMEFRSEILRDFRARYIQTLKAHTSKPVGAWSEFYPTEHYALNMGEAPGADFLMYDLSFGDVTTDQRIAFAETHGDMQHHPTFESWIRHELPLMARGAAEGVTPIGFQFPMRRGHATDFLAKTTVFIDNIEDEYSLKAGPYIRKLIDARDRQPDATREPEVALVYQSFAASALPGGDYFWFYQNTARQIEGMLRQMGVALRVIPQEWLTSMDLRQFKLVIIPDPMYLSRPMRTNLARAKKVLYAGEYLLSHRDPDTESGNFRAGWSAVTNQDGISIRYAPIKGGGLSLTSDPLVRGLSVPPGLVYPDDQGWVWQNAPARPLNIISVGSQPILSRIGDDLYTQSRFFTHAWRDPNPNLEIFAFRLMKRIVQEAGVTVRVRDGSLAPVKMGFPYSSYGFTGGIAWNATQREISLRLETGQKLTIPAQGWAALKQ